LFLKPEKKLSTKGEVLKAEATLLVVEVEGMIGAMAIVVHRLKWVVEVVGEQVLHPKWEAVVAQALAKVITEQTVLRNPPTIPMNLLK
jgi:hypothetical protein